VLPSLKRISPPGVWLVGSVEMLSSDGSLKWEEERGEPKACVFKERYLLDFLLFLS
jgi:hypothetical protein